MTSCDAALICPLCRASLTRSGHSFRCAAGHNFDQARTGSLNLLPARRGVKPPPGDTREMALARRRIMEGGHFVPLTRLLASICAAHLETATPNVFPPLLLDAGCGEGSHIGHIAEALRASAIDACFIGMDASKASIALAARRFRGVRFAVADLNHGIWVADGSVSVLLNVFAPRNAAEFRRVLRADGLLVVVVPQPSHLHELREHFALLSIPEDKPGHVLQRLGAGFELQARTGVDMRIVLNAEQARDLIAMTPNAWHVQHDRLPASLPGDAIEVTLAFDVLRLVRPAKEHAGPD